jgi:hypothetical protein
MIEWSEDGLVLAARPHGETAVVAQLLTRTRGRHAGLVHGGQSPRHAGLLQPGNLVHATWRARLSEHLGTYALETKRSHAARFLSDADRLAALASATAVCETALPAQADKLMAMAAKAKVVARPARFLGRPSDCPCNTLSPDNEERSGLASSPPSRCSGSTGNHTTRVADFIKFDDLYEIQYETNLV